MKIFGRSRLRRGSAVVLGAVLLGAALSGCSTAPRSLGPLAWSDAIASSADSRTLTVSADVDQAWASAGCADFSEKVMTRETATSVRVGVTGYAAALPLGTSCSADRVAATSVTVHLKAPLGKRSLVDTSTGDTHPFLNLAETPALHAAPAHFSEQTGYWTEDTGVAYRWWRRFHPAAQINVYSGPSATLRSHLQKLPTGGMRVQVRGSSGVLHRTTIGDIVDTRVDWSLAEDRAIDLEVLDQSSTPLTSRQVLELAQATY